MLNHVSRSLEKVFDSLAWLNFIIMAVIGIVFGIVLSVNFFYLSVAGIIFVSSGFGLVGVIFALIEDIFLLGFFPRIFEKEDDYLFA